MTNHKLVWLTDIHLDYLKTEEQFAIFIDEVISKNPDSVVITGDISEAPTLLYHLGVMRDNLGVPMRFVLGNHDYYRGSFSQVRGWMQKLFPTEYLPCAKAVELTENTVLVGHDGWYDGGYADWFDDKVIYMKDDYDTILELAMTPRSANGRPVLPTLFGKLQKLAKEGSEHLESVVPGLVGKYTNIIIATHVPPFPENSVHNGQISNPVWLPNFSSKIMGDCLIRLAKRFPDTKFTLLCGHSHGSATYQPLKNLVCMTGMSDYKQPEKSIKLIELG